MSLTPTERLQELEEQIRAMNIRIIYSRNLLRDGYCQVKGESVILLGSRLAPKEKVEWLEASLQSIQAAEKEKKKAPISDVQAHQNSLEKDDVERQS